MPHADGNNGSRAPIRLLLAEQSTLLRTALAAFLASQPGIAVVATLPCDGAITATVAECCVDVVVIGVDESDEECLAVVGEVRRCRPKCRVVALTMPGAPGLYAHLLAVPVHAIVDKDSSTAELVAAIRAVAGGGALIPRTVLNSARQVTKNPFSKREQEVLALAASGATAAQIAQLLNLTNGTVRNYLSSIMTKTEAHTRIDAIRTAKRHGWL